MNQALQPPDNYKEMAMAVLANAPDIRDFLSKCEACGLPVEDRRNQLDMQCEFCTNFLRNFYPEQ